MSIPYVAMPYPCFHCHTLLCLQAQNAAAARAEHEKQRVLEQVQQQMEQMRAEHAADAEKWTQRLASLTGETGHSRALLPTASYVLNTHTSETHQHLWTSSCNARCQLRPQYLHQQDTSTTLDIIAQCRGQWPESSPHLLNWHLVGLTLQQNYL